MHIWGWMAPVELEWLGEQAAQMDSVAEIGSLHGRSAYMLLSRCPGAVYCIDPWDDLHDLSMGSFLGACGGFANLRVVRGLSPPAALLVPEVDMTFLDGAHAYEAVLADIATWLPKTRKLLCGHDFQNADGGYPGVEQAVHEVFGYERVTCAEGTSIWAVDVGSDRSVAEGLPSLVDFTDEYGRARRLGLDW